MSVNCSTVQFLLQSNCIPFSNLTKTLKRPDLAEDQARTTCKRSGWHVETDQGRRRRGGRPVHAVAQSTDGSESRRRQRSGDKVEDRCWRQKKGAGQRVKRRETKKNRRILGGEIGSQFGLRTGSTTAWKLSQATDGTPRGAGPSIPKKLGPNAD